MEPQTALAILLACAGAPETPSEMEGMSQVEVTTEVITDWLDNGGDPWGFATYEAVNTMRSIATEYANGVPAEAFPAGSSPEQVVVMVNALAARVEPFCTE